MYAKEMDKFNTSVEMLSKERTISLNLLKIISAIIIAYVYHYRNDFCMYPVEFPFEETSIVGWWSIYGFLLTEMFFMLSGIAFSLAYQDKIEKNVFTFDVFIRGRIKRLLPKVIVSTFFMTVLQVIHYNLTQSWWLSDINIWNVFIPFLGVSSGWFNMTCVVNMPLWYISVLLQCYILAYVFIRGMKKYNITKSILVLPVVICLSLEYSGAINFNFFLLNPLSVRGIQSFFGGIVLVWIFKDMEKVIVEYRRWMVLLCYFIIGFIWWAVKYYGPQMWGDLPHVLLFIIYPCLIFISIYSNIWYRIAANKLLKVLGKITFDIYMEFTTSITNSSYFSSYRNTISVSRKIFLLYAYDNQYINFFKSSCT